MKNKFVNVLIIAQFAFLLSKKANCEEHPPIVVNIHTTLVQSQDGSHVIETSPRSLASDSHLTKLLPFITNNPKKPLLYILAISATILWLKTYFQIKKTENLLKKSSSWSSWKNHLSLKNLFNTNREDLIKDLTETINLQSSKNNNTKNFHKNIKHEKRLLKKYQKIESWIKMLHFSFLFPRIKKISSQEILERKQRLDFIKSLIQHES